MPACPASFFTTKVNAIVSSGYSNDPVIANYKEYGFAASVTKPYQVKDISEALLQALNA
jgi:hypothetical protein